MHLTPGGVEFLPYADLPHQYVPVPKNDVSFAVQLLERLVTELKQRGDVIQDLGSFARYRGEVGAMPRLVVVIDEFQTLFDEPKLARSAGASLEEIALKGRKYGVHLVLATQSLASDALSSVSSRTLAQFSVRIALPMNSERDASKVLHANPHEIALISERGEALYADASRGAQNVALRVGYAADPAAWLGLRREILTRCAASAPPGTRRSGAAATGAAPTSVADLMPDESWGREKSFAELRAPIGHALSTNLAQRALGEAPEPYTVSFKSSCAHALVVGASGSGKSSFFHALILSLCARYSPEELELHLIDMKSQGVGFAPYRELRHVKFIALGGEAAVALTALRQLSAGMNDRNKLFRSVDGGVDSIDGYRHATGTALPRVLVIIDEFQQLFAGSGAESGEAVRVLREVASLGRSAGLHLVLATQSMNSDLLQRHLDPSVVAQCGLRVALTVARPEDLARTLTREPGKGMSPTRPGDAVFEEGGAQKLVRIAYGPDEARFREARRDILQRLAADYAQGRPAPRVFESGVAPPFAAAMGAHRPTASPRRAPLLLGERLDAGLAPAVWTLQRSPDAHLLVLGGGIEDALQVLGAACASLLAGWGAGRRGLTVVNLAPLDDAERADAFFERLRAFGGDDVSVAYPEDLSAVLERLAASLDAPGEGLAAPRVVCLFGLHGSAITRSPLGRDDKARLTRILNDGPGKGLFVAAWGASLPLAREVFDAQCQQRAFAMRVGLGEPEARTLASVQEYRLAGGQGALQFASAPEQLVRFRFFGEVEGWLAREAESARAG